MGYDGNEAVKTNISGHDGLETMIDENGRDEKNLTDEDCMKNIVCGVYGTWQGLPYAGKHGRNEKERHYDSIAALRRGWPQGRLH